MRRRNFLLAIGLAPFLWIEKPRVERSRLSLCHKVTKPLHMDEHQYIDGIFDKVLDNYRPLYLLPCRSV